jgi:hypothetical protein
VNSAHDRLAPRLDIDIADADIAWPTAAKALESLDQARYDVCALQRIFQIQVSVL